MQMVAISEAVVGDGDVGGGDGSENCKGEVERPSRRLWRRWGAERKQLLVGYLLSVRSGLAGRTELIRAQTRTNHKTL